jgi:hypothetical protein
LTHGPFFSHLMVRHRCDNPRCVRPDHLSLGSHEDNMGDLADSGKQRRPKRLLTDEQKVAIRTTWETGLGYHKVARIHGVCVATVKSVLAGSHTVVSDAEWRTIKQRQGGRCAVCGELSASLQRDHIVPVVAGGTNGADNVQATCSECNRKRNAVLARTLERCNGGMVRPRKAA